MQQNPEWLFDEASATDFTDPREAEAYEKRATAAKDARNQAILDFLQLTTEQTVIDLGTGYGSFALAAAPHCRMVYAVDVSEAMLELARKKAEARNLNNISFLQGGYLTYEHKDPPVDAVVSCNALHHLPDFWKIVALQRMARMLKPGGKLHLDDFYFSFDHSNYKNVLEGWMLSALEKHDKEQANIRARLTRVEHPTFTWIIEEMIRRAGFAIESCRYATSEMHAFYHCTKP